MSTTTTALTGTWATATAERKQVVIDKLFKLAYPPPLPIATIEELAVSGADLDTTRSVLAISADTLSLIARLEAHPVARGSVSAAEDWSSLDVARRVDIATKMFRHENLIPAYEDPDDDAERRARLETLLDADARSPSFWSNLGDLALASVVNILSDYVFFNAFRWNPAEHDGQHVSMAYRVFQVSLQAYSSLWLAANHGTGTGLAFWWNQWNAVNDFGYYVVGGVFDRLGIRPDGWDTDNWQGFFDERNPPTWFSWTWWALGHPGEPTTGTNIGNGALGSIATTVALLQPSANHPWRSSTCMTFPCKVGRFLSRLVPGAVL